MASISLAKIAEIIQSNASAPDLIINHFCIDSREAQSNSLFFALPGEQSDGHRYVPNLPQNAWAVIDQQRRSEFPDDAPVLPVANPLTALQSLAHWVRKQHPQTFFFGLTGTSGKTTTRELIVSILKTQFKVHSSKLNYNNHLGLPLSLLAMPEDTEIGIFELGMNHLGEIADLSAILEPQAGLITSIGAGHTEGVGSLEGVFQAKMELFRALPLDALRIFNANQPFTTQIKAEFPQAIAYGDNDHADRKIHSLQIQPNQTDFYLDNVPFQLGLPGAHNAWNASAAIIIGEQWKLSHSQMQTALQHPQIFDQNRMQLRPTKPFTIIDDCYNSNPLSLNAALDYLQTFPQPRIAVLGDMLELGSLTKTAHQELYTQAATICDTIITVGQHFAPYSQHSFATITELMQAWPQLSLPAGTLLIKGSHSIHLEKLVDFLIKKP